MRNLQTETEERKKEKEKSRKPRLEEKAVRGKRRRDGRGGGGRGQGKNEHVPPESPLPSERRGERDRPPVGQERVPSDSLVQAPFGRDEVLRGSRIGGGGRGVLRSDRTGTCEFVPTLNLVEGEGGYSKHAGTRRQELMVSGKKLQVERRGTMARVRTVLRRVTNHGAVRSSSACAAAWSYSLNRSGYVTSRSARAIRT